MDGFMQLACIDRRLGIVKQYQRAWLSTWRHVTCLTPQLNTECTKSSNKGLSAFNVET